MIKNLHLWLGSYLRQEIARVLSPVKVPKPVHVMFCFVDHFEPDWNKADEGLQNLRVAEWVEKYPLIAKKHKDADGCFPKHTFFYPIEVYREDHVEKIAGLCKQGFGEVEIHLHHDRDREISLKKKIEAGREKLERHGLLAKDKEGKVRYGFIHGNWALNNSRPDGRWCGVNNEAAVLMRTGCYADFTYPSAPSDTQPRIINSIYYQGGDPLRPKAHDTGMEIKVEKIENGRGKMENPSSPIHSLSSKLILIQGPLTLNWQKRKWGIFPKIENGDVTGINAPSNGRVDLWIKQHIHVKGKPDWVFVKVHTHGAQEGNIAVLLHGSLDRMFDHLERKYNDGENYVLHYVTAREMYNIVKAAEAGETGEPGQYRNYVLKLGCRA